MKTYQFKSCSKKTLAQAYNVSYKTFNRWLVPHKDKIGVCCSRCYTPKQVEQIVSIFGIPEKSNLICV
ncbi:hypothetical protein [Aquimarina hainanensis]|uniref:hypothetical protein n=1 Tax=Aquimarina hainanensis TaxID=1578017 RepID=UPI0036226453